VRKPTEEHGVKRLPRTRVEWTQSEVARLDDDLMNRLREKMQTVEPGPLPPGRDEEQLQAFSADLAMDVATEFGRRHDMTADESSILTCAVLGVDDMNHLRRDLEIKNAPQLVKAMLKRFECRTLQELGLFVFAEAFAGRWWELHMGCGAAKGKK